jgi:hypothetical protein
VILPLKRLISWDINGIFMGIKAISYILIITVLVYIYTDWWFGTFFIFPYIGNNHPN